MDQLNRFTSYPKKDKVARRDLQLWMIERNPPNDVVEINGSNHMVMMSKQIELWAHLQGIAEKYSYPTF